MHHSIEYGLNGWDYKIYRKDYCENIDSRLGFKCTTTIIDYKYQCQVDHVDENHNNNNRKNLQTLCADCHAIKTKYFRTSDVKKLKFMNEQIIRSYNKQLVQKYIGDGSSDDLFNEEEIESNNVGA